ncbi:retrovirus-related pol polyprotein from transposon 17.6 [Tanacetum coccineum]
MPPKKTTTPMIDVTIKELIAQGVADDLAEYEANRNSGNGDDSHDSGSGIRRTEHTTRECTYSDFLKCQPLNFKGTEGVVVKIIGHDAAYGMPWKTLMKMMTDNYTQRFQELALMCGRMFPEESDQVEQYVGGLPDIIQGSVTASKPKTMQEAIKFANDLMDQKIHTFAEKQAENKRRLDNNSSDNNAQQAPFKRQNVARAYSARPSENKEYAGTLLLCNKCKFHHNRPCTVKCANCNRVGHLTRDCRFPAATNNQRTLTCYEYGNQGYYKSDFLELKNRNHGNQARGTEARGMVYALGGGETDQDPNNMEDDINA